MEKIPFYYLRGGYFTLTKQNIALIDIGSNSIRLVIFQLDDSGYYKEIQNVKVVARLSSFLSLDGYLSSEGITVLLNSLYQFQEITRTYNLTKTKCVATAAIRQSKNQAEILSLVQKRTDFSIRVLSEYEEAFFGYLAVTNSTCIEDGITIDIGGGSTEVTLFKNRKLLQYHSFPFGAISLKQRFIHEDVPSKEEMLHLKKYLKKQFASLPWLTEHHVPVIGIGGSARNLSLIQQRKINYPLSGLHQFEMSASDLHAITNQLTKLTFKERQNIDGLSKDRADIIVPAAEAINSLMEATKATTFMMSNKGLRDGLFYEELFTQLHIDFFPNVAEESIFQLTRDYEIDINSVKHISKLATQLFFLLQNKSELELTKTDLRLLNYSCRLLYLGEFISYEASSQHTFYLLTNLSIDGIHHMDRLKIALIASFKSKKSLQQYIERYKHLLTKDDIQKLELLGAILKFCYSLNRTKRQVISAIELGNANDTEFSLKLTSNEDPYFEKIQAQKHKKHLEKFLMRRIELLFCRD